MRLAARKDSTQADIVKELRAHGYLVDIRNEYGKPDLLVRNLAWPPGLCTQMETKTPNRADGSYKPSPSESKRRKKQQDYCRDFGVPIIKSAQEALEWLRCRDLRIIRGRHK